jgi:acyl-CoA thioesterase I
MKVFRSTGSRSGDWFLVGIFAMAAIVGILTTSLLVGVNLNRGSIGSADVPKQALRQPFVMLGDSLAEGFGATDPQKTLAYQVFAGVRNPSDSQLWNFGTSGAQVGGVIREQVPRAILVEPKTIGIVVGANDVTRGVPVEAWSASMTQVLQQLTEKTAATIVVANVPRLSETPAIKADQKPILEARTTLYNLALNELVKQFGARVTVFDLYTVSADKLSAGSGLLADDGFHPNNAGYTVAAEAFIPVVKQAEAGMR